MDISTRINLILFGLICLFCSSLTAQKSHSVIVKFTDDQLLDAQQLKQQYGAISSQCIFRDLGLYELTLPSSQQKKISVTKLRSAPEVIYVHDNIMAYNRLTPNDPEYPSQWNIRQIGLHLGWDITTGGPNYAGHDMVIGVLDDGYEIDHPDLADRIWINTAEIPDNGIDDDNNGYVDDVYGLNALSESDEHLVSGHGTSVLGILGANADNDLQIAGVDWHVKMMLTSSGTPNGYQLSDIVKSFEYIYEQRKRYNESNGAEGAYVVATNYSGGRDEAFPELFPSWCEVYDVLGSVGIINIGSTSNENNYVDEVGDLPSTCPSDYLIVTTNTNRLDQKVENAGYGDIGVDLGAPGDDVTTIARGGGTRPDFMGTSAAAPHVAGVVSLMYSLMCEEGYRFSLENPAEMALIVKSTILDNVTPSTFLADITTSGGVLNALSTLEAFDEAWGDCCEIVIDSLMTTPETCIDSRDASLILRATGLDLTGDIIYEISNTTGTLANLDGDFSRLTGGAIPISIYDEGATSCRIDTMTTIFTSGDACPFGNFEIQQIRTDFTGDRIEIDYDLDEQKDVTFEVFASDGRLMYIETVTPDLSEGRIYSISTSNWPSGIYRAAIRANGFRNIKAFAVIR